MPAVPVLFMKPGTSLAGPGDVPIPAFVHADAEGQQLDFETELAFITSREARDVRPEDAHSYILGYASANDITARFHQARQTQWNFAKGFDKFCPIGPCIVAADAIGDVQNLAFEGKLNGESMQKDNTS